ncbi:MAG: hypothetical protein V1843_03715 [bacterium]
MIKKRAFIAIILCFALSVICIASISEIIKFPAQKVGGKGPLPYNYRIIDKHIHAGGHPLNPSTNFGNSDKEVKNILHYLKSKGVLTIIDLENTLSIQSRYARLLKEAGLERLHIPMSSSKVPTKAEWQAMKKAMEEPVYIYCKWGADRTGAVIGRYLVEEYGYSKMDAIKAVSNYGTHAGPIGGLKSSLYPNLVKFIQKGPK